mmetsp:Transcript_12206/g.17683  ORF Transcript_12206/g.17683 Transcript_12206/m.17683 type:complete len:340 (+) Transcript_12206:57-1076(+)
MFEHIVHLQALHINWGATEIGITNGNTPDGRDHAGHTATSYRGTENTDAEGNNLGGGCAGAHGGGVACNTREDVGNGDNDFVHYQHDGGSQINNYFHDFGHTHTDNVKGSDINQNDMGHDNDGVATSGTSTYGDADDINQGDWYMHSNYLKTDGFDGPNGTGDDFVAGGRGMFGDYAVHALWHDTTNMDNIRYPSLGGTESMPTGCHGSLSAHNLSCYHSATQYTNNDTDNSYYWSTPGGTHMYEHQNYTAGQDAMNRSGDNGWQRAGNGYTHGDFGAGSVAGNCNVGDTCTVSNTFTGSGYGTVNDAANVVANNNGTWGAGSDSVGTASSSNPNSISK